MNSNHLSMSFSRACSRTGMTGKRLYYCTMFVDLSLFEVLCDSFYPVLLLHINVDVEHYSYLNHL